MFKLAQRTQLNSKLSIQGLSACSNMQTSILSLSTRGIKAKHLISSPTKNVGNERRQQDVYGQIDGCLGIVKLNREHRYNMLTPSFIDEVNRGIASMEVNQNVSTIYMAPHLGQMFSNGTDFRTLAFMQQEGSDNAIADYMQKICQLQVQVAALNKPIIAVAPGHSFNSGATLLAATGIPLVQQGSKIAFNEVSFGFVPHAGATYYLSRLPGEFGTFMALTGMQVDGSDAIQLGLAQGAVQDPLKLQEEVGEIIRSQEFRPDYGSEYHKNLFLGENYDRMYFQGSDYRNMEEETYAYKLKELDETRRRNGNLEMGRFEEFIEAEDRVPSSVADAEYRYMKMLRRDHFLNGNKDPNPYLEYGKNELDRNNLFLYYESFKTQHQYVSLFLDHWYHQDINVAIKHKQLIDRCFYSKSVEEIMENLRNEVHPFAKECLESMQRNSMASMQLTREMMHRALNLDYTGCMQMEVDVSLNRIRDPDFQLGVDKVLRVKTPFVAGKKGTRKNPGFNKKILTQNEINKYFEPSNLSKKVNVGAVRHALLPTRHHFERFTDHLRIWINEESCSDDRIRGEFDAQAKQALRQHGIDVRDKALTIQSAREHLAAKLAKERVEEVRKQRFDQVMLDEQLRDAYYGKVNDELNKLVANQSIFRNRVQAHIRDIFEIALQERLEKIFEKSKEAQSLEKRRMMIRLKKFMFKNRVLTYSQQTLNAEIERTKNYPYRLLHGQEKWDQSWHDVAHPLMDKSPLAHIAKAIGRVSYSPVEMTREFLTKPQRREQLSMVTLDPKELHTLQNDVIKNPEKYIQMFTRPEKLEYDLTFHENSRQRPEMVFAMKEQWWRMYNDYMSPTDTWPQKQQFEMYKEWAMGVEGKAIDTLRNCISTLLVELKDDIQVSLEVNPNSTKREKLEQLLGLLDQASHTLPSNPKEKVLKPKSTQDNLDSLETMIQKLMASDQNFACLYPKDSDGKLTTNKYIIKLRTEAEQELLKLIEIVLLDKYGKFTTKDQRKILNQRLETLFTKEGHGKNNVTVQQQLGVIDQYLEIEGKHEALRDALDLVKPYFVNIFQRRLQEVADELLEKMQWKTTNHLIQTNYFGELAFPGYSAGSQAEKRMLNPTDEHDQQMMFEKAFPFARAEFKQRELQAEWAEKGAELHLDPEYQALSLTEKKKREIKEARSRTEQYEELEAEKVLNKMVTVGMKDADACLREMFKNNFAPETIALLENIDKPENIEELRKAGFKKHHIGILKKLSKFKKELEAKPTEKKEKVDYLTAFQKLREQEQLEIESLKSQEQQIVHFLTSIRYEIDHNLSAFDWLKMYSEVMEKKDFNEIIENYHYSIQKIQFSKNRPIQNTLYDLEPFEYTPPTELLKTKEEWKELKEYSDFVSDFFKASNETCDDQTTIDLQPFMKQQQSDVKTNIFEQALAARNEFVKSQKDKYFVNRNLLIKNQIEDFNSLQEQKETNRKLHIAIRAALAGKPKQTRDFVEEVLQEGKYIDLELLKKKLSTGQPLEGLINTQRLIQDLNKSDALIPGFFDKFAEMPIDVLSLDEIKQVIAIDNSLSAKAKSYANDVVQHVQQQTTYVSNEKRKSITMKQFLGNHHHSNSESFTQFASNVLAQKIREAIGSTDIEGEAPNNIQWELGRSRTSPFDLKPENRDSKEKINEFIQKIISDQAEDAEKTIGYYDDEVLAWRLDPVREHELKKVMLDAADATTLPQDLDQVQIYYENQFLLAMASPNEFEEKAQIAIQEYTQNRLRYCMLQPDFQAKIKSKYGFIYMKMLRERVSDELKLTQNADPSDLSYENLNWEKNERLWLDVESKYNLRHLNNTNALGFDNLLERAAAQTETENANIAQPSVLDKLMADYFLTKKNEYQQANNLMKDLADMFDEKKQGYDNLDSIMTQLCKTEMGKETSKEFNFEAFKDMMDLDVITSKAMQNNKNGLSNELRQVSITETENKDHWLTQVPEYFEMMDVRKPADKAVDDKLFMLIKQAFDVRKDLEKKMNRRELIAFDKVLNRHLRTENLVQRLKDSVTDEFNLVNQGRQVAESRKINKFNEEIQLIKRESPQREQNKEIKDPDAQYKQLAFQTILELEGKAIMEKPGKVSAEKMELEFVEDTFNRWYLRELEKDAKRNPRPVNPEEFERKKPYELTPSDHKFKDMPSREEAMFEEQQVYQENKLEQQQRIQLFYVLEQFFEQARNKPEPESVAQAQIKEYFSKPENTFFFDKNKI